jgi:translation initiation factor IF-2
MAKIRVQDLARRMGLENQDLVFKLKSIGVRVEGDEALIDTDIIQAILLGKRLPQPREVILRDDNASPAAAVPGEVRRPAARRPAGARHRRSMIQRVEPRIREIEVRQRPPEPTRPAEARPAEARPARPPAARPAAKEMPAAEAPETPPAPAAPEADKAAADKAAADKAAADKAAADKAAADKAAADKAAAAKAGKVDEKAQPAKARTAPREAPRGEPRPPRRPPAQPAPSRDAARPGAGGMRHRRGARPGMAEAQRPIQRPARGPATGESPRQPVSARGHRRAQRKQEESPRTTSGLQFRDERPSGPVTIAEGMTVREFAEKLGVKAKDLIKALVMRGVMANINHVLDPETARSLAEELGIETMEVSFEEEVQLQQESSFEGAGAEKVGRPPVVTVMGHVDHGKTTLLDRIRSTSVVDDEAGGITQHIGASQVEAGERRIVFLDTPGHEAFTMMRARGAKVTDIVVLVVAADDSVMPQTVEAINHAKAAGVPIVVAINKIDKTNANLDRVRKELADQGLMVEDWGGETVSVALSALKGEGVEALLEMILLTADLLELKASPALPAYGAVLEARKEVGRGIIATVLVQNGTLRTGDVFVAGSTWGRVRMMTDDRAQRLEEAGPATPVEVTGFTEVPGAGDLFQVMEDESKARSIAEHRSDEERQRELRPVPGRMSLEQLLSQREQGEAKELAIIIKADVDGSVEVLRETLTKLSTDKVRVKVIHSGVGAISTNDVILASASEAVIVGFNVRPERNAAALAEKEEVDVRLHTVIYELSDELKRAMTGLLEPTFREVRTGTAEIRDAFRIPKIGVIAGAHVVEGHIPRGASARLLRDNVVVWEGRIASLKRFKEDVSEVRSGFDCGIGLERFQDVKPGDSLEAFTREEVAPTL